VGEELPHPTLPNQEILVLNSVLWSPSYSNCGSDGSDPGTAEIKWLSWKLYEAKILGNKVILVMHIPSRRGRLQLFTWWQLHIRDSVLARPLLQSICPDWTDIGELRTDCRLVLRCNHYGEHGAAGHVQPRTPGLCPLSCSLRSPRCRRSGVELTASTLRRHRNAANLLCQLVVGARANVP
jgi:hypothetical protein